MTGTGPAEPQETRPADEARRALREARERETRGAGADVGDETEPHPAPGAEQATPSKASTPGRRPGDVAREALRRAAGAGAVQGTDADSAPDPEEPTEDVRPPVGAAQEGARPGDIAREALRTAREQARHSRTESEARTAEPNTTPGRRPTAGTPTTPRNPRRATQNQAQALRDLLADAFRLPDAGAPERRPSSDGPSAGSLPDDGNAGEGGDQTGGSEARDDRPLRDSRAARRDRALRDPGRGLEAASDAQALSAAGDGTWDRPVPDAEGGSDPAARPDHTPQDNDPSQYGTSLPGEAGASLMPEEPEGLASGVRRVRVSYGDEAPEQPSTRPSARTSARQPAPRAESVAAGALGDAATDAPGAAPTHRLPRSMAAPGRDSDLRRTFAALPPRSADAFAETWWGNAWVTALEEGALDAARLARGRAYAAKGFVDAITVTPGLVLAYVHGSRPRPYRVQVRLRTLSDEDWDRFLDAAAERPGHIAALLDKEMPQSLADCGVALLPGPGDLEPHCSCPDSGHPCKHAAALCYQTARLLDEDPFVLLLLRGRGERELLDALSRRNAARAARAALEQEPAPLPGVRAADALRPRTLPPLPAPQPPPAHPEQPPVYPGAPGGPDPFALDQLATDAAARAHTLLTAGRDPVAELTLWQDAVRLAAARPGSGLTAATRALYSSLASAAGRTPSDLARAVAAWRQGGLEGLTVLEEPWDPPAGRFDRARPLLLAADLPAFRPWRNHLTHPRGHAQLRLGHDGLWYAYESEPGHDDWWPRGTPDLDPVGALTGLGAPGDL
ncbi:SWIM zinc finger family protein [Streptomyces sp. R21]|uniref:SWIM zinc finger family protein n=1 Tax=Streptomyces sp. R21 TaxID=3238627 RepID=A0AB39P7E0_9ACTN